MGAIVYVVDSGDSRRFEESSQELKDLLTEDKLAAVPLLVYCNKQDLDTAQSDADIQAHFKLDDEVGASRAWAVQACSAVSGNGLEEGMNWVVENATGPK